MKPWSSRCASSCARTSTRRARSLNRSNTPLRSGGGSDGKRG
jgi:hypothetical protein